MLFSIKMSALRSPSVLALASVTAITLAACSSTGKLHEPFGVDSPLPTATPASVNLDSEILQRVSEDIRGNPKHKIHSLLVARNGSLVHEEYFNGYGPNTPHDLRSATKSITSVLTGIAIDNNLLDLDNLPPVNRTGRLPRRRHP